MKLSLSSSAIIASSACSGTLHLALQVVLASLRLVMSSLAPARAGLDLAQCRRDVGLRLERFQGGLLGFTLGLCAASCESLDANSDCVDANSNCLDANSDSRSRRLLLRQQVLGGLLLQLELLGGSGFEILSFAFELLLDFLILLEGLSATRCSRGGGKHPAGEEKGERERAREK